MTEQQAAALVDRLLWLKSSDRDRLVNSLVQYNALLTGMSADEESKKKINSNNDLMRTLVDLPLKETDGQQEMNEDQLMSIETDDHSNGVLL